MLSTMRKARLLRLTPLCALLVLPACVGGRPIVVPTPPACSTLLPTEWDKGVPSADIDNDGATVGDWIKFGDAQTGQLDKANDHYVSGVGIIRRCEARDAAAIKHAKPKFLGVF